MFFELGETFSRFEVGFGRSVSSLCVTQWLLPGIRTPNWTCHMVWCVLDLRHGFGWQQCQDGYGRHWIFGLELMRLADFQWRILARLKMQSWPLRWDPTFLQISKIQISPFTSKTCPERFCPPVICSHKFLTFLHSRFMSRPCRPWSLGESCTDTQLNFKLHFIRLFPWTLQIRKFTRPAVNQTVVLSQVPAMKWPRGPLCFANTFNNDFCLEKFAFELFLWFRWWPVPAAAEDLEFGSIFEWND